MLALVAVILALVLAMTYVLRLMGVILLTAVAPLALACYALPQTAWAARWWWRAMTAVLVIPAAQALVLTAAVKVFFTTAWVNTGIGQYLLHMLITICLLYILMRIPFWIARPALTPFGRSPLRRAARFAFTAAVLSRVAPVLRGTAGPPQPQAGAARRRRLWRGGRLVTCRPPARRPALSRLFPGGDVRVSDTARQRVPVPADVELPDKLVAGLTGRQAVITAIAVLVIWAGFKATRTVLPLPVFAVLAAPVAVVATALAIGQRDGLTLDRLLAAAWRQARSPRRMVTAPEGVPAVPGWVAPGLARQAGPRAGPGDAAVAAGHPGRGDRARRDGAAAVCAVSTVNFALRSPAEQDALTAAYGRWLHSLTGPVQILIRTGHADLASAISRLREDAPSLPDPALEQAALAHAGFLAGLGATRQVLTRQVLLVTRETGRAVPGRPGSAAGRAAQRTAEAARLLASADLQARPLDGAQVTALLAAACDPGGPHRAQRLAPPGPLTRQRARRPGAAAAACPAPGRTGCPPRPPSRSPPGTSRSTGTAPPPWP